MEEEFINNGEENIVKLEGKKVEPIISSEGLKILVVSGDEQKGEEDLVGDLLRNGNSSFKIIKKEVEKVKEVKVEPFEENVDGKVLPKKDEKKSQYKGTAGFGGIEVMSLNLLKEVNIKDESDIEKLKSCLSEADVVIYVDTDGVVYGKESANKEILAALTNTCKSGKLVISWGTSNGCVNNNNLNLISKDCRFEIKEKRGENNINVLKFIAYKTNKGVLNSIRRNKVKAGVGFIGLEEFLGQSLFGKSILGAVLGYNSNSKEKNVKDVTDKKNARNEKNKEVNNSGNQVE